MKCSPRRCPTIGFPFSMVSWPRRTRVALGPTCRTPQPGAANDRSAGPPDDRLKATTGRLGDGAFAARRDTDYTQVPPALDLPTFPAPLCEPKPVTRVQTSR